MRFGICDSKKARNCLFDSSVTTRDGRVHDYTDSYKMFAYMTKPRDEESFPYMMIQCKNPTLQCYVDILEAEISPYEGGH